MSKTRVAGAGDQTAELTATPAASVARFGQLLVARFPGRGADRRHYAAGPVQFSAAAGRTPSRYGWYGAIVICAVAVLAGYLAQRDHTFRDSGGKTTHSTTPAAPKARRQQQSPPGSPAAAAATDTSAMTALVRAPPPPSTSPSGKLHLPFLPAITAMLSMAVYGLTVPGTLSGR